MKKLLGKFSLKQKLSLLFLLIALICTGGILLINKNHQRYQGEARPPIDSSSDTPLLPQYNNPGQGIFQCHSDTNVNKDYVKGGGIIIKWREYQPDGPNSLSQEKMNWLLEKIRRLKASNRKAYLSFAIFEYFDFPTTLDAFPDWLNIYDDNPSTDEIEMIRVLIRYSGSEAKYYYFPAPWGIEYQTKLGNFLKLMEKAFEENNLLDTIEYIEPSAGGFWASTHLHFKTDEQLNYFVRAAGCNENDWSCLGRKYTQGVNEIIAVYLESFPNHPIMFAGGGCRHSECSYNGIDQLLQEYGMRVRRKGAGLGASYENRCGLRADALRPLCKYPPEKSELTKCGEEPWLASVCEIGSEACGPGFNPESVCAKNYEQVYKESLKKEYVSYYCIYSCDLRCPGTQETNRFTASHLGAQIKLVSFEFNKTSARIGQNFQINFKWQNNGSTALIAPLKQGKKWVASSYKLFLEFVKNDQIKHYQEFTINPPTYTWQADKETTNDVDAYFEAQTTTSINIPNNLEQGIYKIYAGLTDPNGENKRFVLINNDSRNDTSNRRYLLTDSFEIVKGEVLPTPTPTPSPISPEQIIGRVFKDDAVVGNYTITSSDSKTAGWGENDGGPYFHIGRWSAGTDVTLTLDNPDEGYDCSWEASQIVADKKWENLGSGEGCSGTITVVPGYLSPDWHIHWGFHLTSTPISTVTPTPTATPSPIPTSTPTVTPTHTPSPTPSTTPTTPTPPPTSTPIPPECVNNEDCDDSNLCTTDTCVDGSCEYALISCNEHAECNPSTGNCQCFSDNWGNCDNSWDNGCETNLTNEADCGACGNACSEDYVCLQRECADIGIYPACLIKNTSDELGIDVKYISTIEDNNAQWGEEDMCETGNIEGKKLVLQSVYPDSNNKCWQHEYHTAGSGDNLAIHCNHYRLCQEQEISCSQCPANGDFNGDGKVNEFDYGILIAHFGREGVPGEVVGDANCDGVVDEFDYGILIAHFGEGE